MQVSLQSRHPDARPKLYMRNAESSWMFVDKSSIEAQSTADRPRISPSKPVILWIRAGYGRASVK